MSFPQRRPCFIRGSPILLVPLQTEDGASRAAAIRMTLVTRNFFRGLTISENWHRQQVPYKNKIWRDESDGSDQQEEN